MRLKVKQARSRRIRVGPPNDIEFSGEKEGARATDAESAARMKWTPPL
jgi:hypothetical protein